MRRRLLLVLPLAAAGLYLWARSSGAGAATAVDLSNESDPLSELSDAADAAVSDLVGWEPPARAAPYLDAINAAESANGIPHNLLARLLYQESRFRPDIIDGTTKSSAGALGIAQFIPSTASQLGVDPLNPSSAIAGAGVYLAQLYSQVGSWSLALAAYNWGPGNVKAHGLDGAPQETVDYVAQITADVPVV